MRTRWPIQYLNIFPRSWRIDSSFREAWILWLTHRKRIKRKMSKRAAELQLGKLKKAGSIKEVVAMIEQSESNGWTGLFPVKDWEDEDDDNRSNKINVGYQGD